ncbi:MAG: nucleotidyl transferase AbiEii/AbiGii toxin family protein [Gammaproteobacteria bacterium]|nr:nucleotidyl transferase AbiEii/AbiGii toxin family protein [Gammaproteobacteria bacterium]MBT4378777.1 nucleotidyl transferase AbiEii/AbiGii toxin family protein [Gammaproteobacteria bacterium]MBT4616072.1 nucleotidyl transferase AbiEii/AbiGii toxin family protein [Gammaproteobacteria bacterium]MBT5445709.1 nucleotidyl transferase AbiEii/AbiGii toxin family protein [Gammaproteobacteria bacterium]MBT5792086.1 nucleotidyl transferase AbiEii/AbiGii toxin family protein [Gammaproteobacteria bact
MSTSSIRRDHTATLRDARQGIEFFGDRFKFKVIEKEAGELSVQGKIHYNGPLRRTQGVASIKLDLTSDEILVLQTHSQPVHHPYSDAPSEGISATCYAFEEVVAEKIRALAQRARPRDLYDVVHFYRTKDMIDNPNLVYSVLEKKCKRIGSITGLFDRKSEYRIRSVACLFDESV